MEEQKRTDMKLIEAEIIGMRKGGKSGQEIADYFGSSKKQIEIGSRGTTKNDTSVLKGYCQGKEAAKGKTDGYHMRMKQQS